MVVLVPKMLQILAKFKRVVGLALLAILMLVVGSSTVELAVLLVEQFMRPPRVFLLGTSELLQIISFFLMVLIGVKLIEVMRNYLKDGKLHVEIVLLTAMIA